jgi:hypothetical protein
MSVLHGVSSLIRFMLRKQNTIAAKIEVFMTSKGRVRQPEFERDCHRGKLEKQCPKKFVVCRY